MNYYFNTGFISVTEAELDLLPLSDEQVQFYSENPTATNSEIEKCELYVAPQPTANDIIELICANYEAVERKNITPIGAIQLKTWVDNGVQMAIDNANWFTSLYTERAEKIEQVMNGDLSIDTFPSSTDKPHTFYEIMESLKQ